MTYFTKTVRGEIFILISTILFAITFIGQRRATKNIAGPTTYNAWRSTVAALLIVIFRKPLQKCFDNTDAEDKIKKENIHALIVIKSYLPSYISKSTFDLYFWGSVCGFANFIISTFQQYGLVTVAAGKASFINGLFVVVTPLFELMLPGVTNKLSMITWISVGLSFIGTCFLSDVESEKSIGIGGIYLLISMLASVINIIATDVGSKRVNCVNLTAVEFTITAILCTISSIYMEIEMWVWPLPALQDGIVMIMLVGFSEAAAYLLSSIGQTHSTSSRAALIYSMESVFTALLGYIFLYETLTYLELFGCLLMCIAIIISSQPEEDIIDKLDFKSNHIVKDDRIKNDEDL